MERMMQFCGHVPAQCSMRVACRCVVKGRDVPSVARCGCLVWSSAHLRNASKEKGEKRGGKTSVATIFLAGSLTGLLAEMRVKQHAQNHLYVCQQAGVRMTSFSVVVYAPVSCTSLLV